MNDQNICPWIISDRLPYPVGGATPVLGRILYESLIESSSVVKIYSFDSSTMLVFQGLTNGTFKLVSISSIKACFRKCPKTFILFICNKSIPNRQKVR